MVGVVRQEVLVHVYNDAKLSFFDLSKRDFIGHVQENAIFSQPAKLGRMVMGSLKSASVASVTICPDESTLIVLSGGRVGAYDIGSKQLIHTIDLPVDQEMSTFFFFFLNFNFNVSIFFFFFLLPCCRCVPCCGVRGWDQAHCKPGLFSFCLFPD